MHNFEVVTSKKNFLTLIEILLSKVEVEEAETELDSKDGVISETIKSNSEEIFSFLQGEFDSFDIPKGAKVTISTFVSVLMNKFRKVEKNQESAENSHQISVQNMTRTKLISKRNYYKQREQFLSSQWPIGNKNIPNRRIKNRQVKIKKIMPQFKNVQVKHGGKEVREIAVRQKTIYNCNKEKTAILIYVYI